jgi:hypothetical protein
MKGNKRQPFSLLSNINLKILIFKIKYHSAALLQVVVVAGTKDKSCNIFVTAFVL